MSGVNAVLFVKDLARIVAFYRDALALQLKTSDDHHAHFVIGSFDFLVHQVPKPIADGISAVSPPRRRTDGMIRLDFPVRDLANARARAKQLGGAIDEQPPPWAGSAQDFFLGFDPEGNVFGARALEPR
jgi:catechol 2,3-dioxygenase-like lactoylglutathione lyase family enzyme